MSSFLYSLGRFAHRARGLVVGIWVLLLALIGAAALLFGQGMDNSISIPGTESQNALSSLETTFPEVSGTSAQIIVVAPDGETVTDAALEQPIDDAVDDLKKIDQVDEVVSPYSSDVSGSISDNESAALITVQLDGSTFEISDTTKQELRDAASDLHENLPDGSTVSVGGELFSQNMPTIGILEGVGVVVALAVLILTFGSLLAAGLPLLTALFGVGISMALIFAATAVTSITSTTPMLALMLGLAVGIDYALFIISRHRDQLRDGLSVPESIARSVATAGSAVVFAGLTVVIALLGLSVAGIPFLTVMGVAAALGVGIAVLVSLTLLPALLAFSGERLRPKAKRAKAAKGTTDAAPAQNRFFLGWVRAVTKHPIVTITAVIAVLGVASVPALGLRLALPDAGGLPEDNSARQTYDLVSEHFGEGYNGMLIVTGSIITSTDPLGLMDDIADEITQLDGVAAVPLATPNRSADTGIIQVVPEHGPDSDQTKQLVHDIRALHDHFLDEYDVDLSVTGFTAVGIDVSTKLGQALLPFGILVVGLSLVLLTMVFRSIAVPIKATLGYLLSVGASFGAVTLVFGDGVLADAIGVARTGPVISFLPIILMGVLFGLAMDYEVFLVSRIREDYVHGKNARRAVETGFVSSAKVVTAAAVIMISVFAAFIPMEDVNIKPIAVGLAVGVFVDAFLVRMTLVPAVLALLGDKAWWMPRWLDRALPSFDVEGEALEHELQLAEWPAPDADFAVAADDMSVTAGSETILRPTSLRVAPATTHALVADSARAVTAALMALTGRVPQATGTIKVLGLVLPSRGPAVRRRTGYVSLAASVNPVDDVRAALAERPQLLAIDGVDHVANPADRAGLGTLLDEVATSSGRPAILIGCTNLVAARDLTPLDDETFAGDTKTLLLSEVSA
ncbi:putative drug exporter of the RND superfamily [Paramicrobacterium humi]|uniref:Putative drug exporter of the RND superfamily n=1 Tax=Paramicrobacterium humi TaxID=640635 RepID=A0A1H4MBN4_9MICO|nr:MMPL family transporter [Microbacterium humi]SEB80510.1 putative drug exporter of the RND superfamily [Microbacterium humi]